MENELTEEVKDNSTKIFIARVVMFVIFGCIIPFVFIAWRYEIFSAKKVSITGWGFIAFIILFFFVKYLMDVLKHSIPFSMVNQIISGITKVILPLVLVYAVVNAIQDSVALFKQVLVITIFSELIAIVVNPFPKYMHDKGIERTESLMDLFIDKWKKKESGE